LAAVIAKLDVVQTWLNNEITVIDADGLPDFNALQNAIDNRRTQDIVYFLFDLPFHDGLDLRPVSLVSRRAMLKQMLDHAPPSNMMRFSENYDATPAQMLAATRAMKLEDVMLKRADAPYVGSRTET